MDYRRSFVDTAYDIVVKNGADEDAGEINAVTGATISSKAVTSAVNKALEYYEVLKMTSSVFIPNGGDVG